MAADPLERYLLLRRPRSDSRVAMRPMESGELMDASLRVYQSLGRTILRLTAIPTLFTFAGLAFLLFVLLPALTVTEAPASTGAQIVEAMMTLALALGVALPIMAVGFSFTTCIVVSLAADYVGGNMPDERSAMRTAIKSLKRLLLLNLYEVGVAFSGIILSWLLLMASAALGSTAPENEVLSGVIAGLAILGFMVGGVIFLIVLGRHAITPATLIVEGLKPMAAIKRSISLMKGNKTHPSGYNVIGALFVLLFFVAIILWPALAATISLFDMEQAIRSTAGSSILGTALLQLLSISPLYVFLWVMIPIWSTTITVTYFERRIRLEGIDVEALAKAMFRSRKEIRFEL